MVQRWQAKVRRWGPWLALLALSAGLHLAVLGQRSYHHDEAIHAKGAWDLAESGRYRYNPTYHGPLLYLLTAATFELAGDSDLTARLPIAFAGIALVAVAFALRRPLGGRAAWWTGLLATVSPLTLYYGRFLRMDVLELVTASAAAVAAWRAVHGRPRAWVWVGVWAGLAFATKENAFVTAALVAAVVALMTVGAGLGRAAPAVVRFVVRHRWGLVAAASAGFVVTTLLYTIGFRHPGDWFFPGTAISYWWDQHQVQRVAGPWWYHLPRLAQYEFLPLLAGLAWCLGRRRRMGRLETALLLFGLASLAMYAYLGEKVAWLGVHQVWAFLPLAGLQLARTFGPAGRWWSRSLAAVGLAATVATSVVASFVLDEISPRRDRVESLVYVQTCPEFTAMEREVRALARSGEDPVAAVSGEAGWPLAWSWRRLPVWWAKPRPGQRPPVVLCEPSEEGELRRALGAGYESERIPLRAWWVIEDTDPGVGDVLRYLVTRRHWGVIGSSDVIVLRRTGEATPEVRSAAPPAALADALGVSAASVFGEGLLVEPRGVAVRADGMVAIADPGLSAVVVLDPEGRPADLRLPPLAEPEGVAFTPEGVLAVADTWNHRVLLADLGRKTWAEAPVPPGGWYGPRAVAASADGRLAVADTGNKRVVVLGRGGSSITAWGGPGSGPGELQEPVGVVWLGDGRLLVCDTGNRRLQVFDRAGRSVSQTALGGAWADFYSRPQATVLADDDWLVSDAPGGRLWRIRAGRVTAIDLAADGLTPSGVAAAGRSLWLADLGGRVWRLER